MQILQRSQNKVVRNILNVPWYIKNQHLYEDLGIIRVDKVIKFMQEKGCIYNKTPGETIFRQ